MHRHGWGCPPNPTLAITYLSAAASNSAAIESSALASGFKKGGTAKGELVLAIFELANCFRHGWGVSKDPFAAKQYYETAANLGDTDAMNEVAWCCLEGFGCKKDKVSKRLGCWVLMMSIMGASRPTSGYWCSYNTRPTSNPQPGPTPRRTPIKPYILSRQQQLSNPSRLTKRAHLP